ncbi:Ig-like domain-containing protein, partial [Acetanaerobacterium elongatum]
MDDTKDIGAGHKFTYLTTTNGGTLKLDDGATLNLLARGTNSSTQYIMGIIGGEGAGQSSGIYYYNRKYNGVIDMSAPGTGWYKGSGYTFSGNTVNINEAGSYCILGETASNHIKISNAITADITLSDASIDVSGIPNSCAFDMTGATVNLALTGSNTLASGENCAGLQVPIGAVLKIVEGSTGSLSASGGVNGSGIGGGSNCTAGNITILGGQIIAEGTTNGAGIGGGLNASGGTVKIGGGKDTYVVCFSLSGYDIGSGDGNSTGGSLEVNDGAMVSMLGKGTNATAKYITGTIGGKGAKLDAGVYLNSQKQLEFFRFVADPEDGAKALETIRLGVVVKGLSQTLPQGTIVFKANGIIIGQTSVTRSDELPAYGIATYEWTNVPGGTQTLTAEYKQDATFDSYYLTDITSINNYEVAKINQSDDLVIKIPEGIKYHDNFNIDVSGGNGTGNLSYKVTPGDALSFNPDGSVTAQKAGPATITVTKSGDIHYLEAEKSVNIVISKVQPPAVVFPTAGELTYGQHLSAAALMGGSGDGSFAWSSPDTVPTVKN